MYPKEYHIQKDDSLEDLRREGAEKEFGKITAWFTEKKALTSHAIQGGDFWLFFFFFFHNKVSLQSQPNKVYYVPGHTEHLI